MVWQTIQHIRCDYQSMLEEATETLEDETLENVLKDDEVQWDILNGIEGKLDELSILKVSPEKEIQVVLDTGFREPREGNTPRGDRSYEEFLYLQTKANKETERKLQDQQKESKRLAEELAALKVDNKNKEPDLQTDKKAALRLPTCPPQKFSGEIVDYIPWKN